MNGRLTDLIVKLIGQALDSRIQFAQVTGTSGNNVLIKRLGQTAADVQAYPRLSSYTPVANDWVVYIQIGGIPFILGKRA